MNIKFTDWRGASAPSPIAMELAQKAGVQQTQPNYKDFMASREPANMAKARMEASTPYPENGQFKPNMDYTSVKTAPPFETHAEAQARADAADTKAYQDSHPGLSSDFSAKIAEILRQGRAAEQGYRESADMNTPRKTMGELAEERMASIPKEQAWRRQNPFAEGMGYQWADDTKLKGLGWGDDDIASMKRRTEFDPQEIVNLTAQGAIRAPYAEYLEEQKRLRQKAEEEAARNAYNYSYSEPSYSDSSEYYEAPSSAPASEPVFKGNYSIQAPTPSASFDQLDSDSVADFKRSRSSMNTNYWGTGRGSY